MAVIDINSKDVQAGLLQIVTELKDGLITSLINAGRHASGDTERAIETPSSDTGAQLTAPQYFYALQDGRKPTAPGAAQSDPNLFTQIVKWMDAKGIVGSPYAITKSIHQKGYQGKPGIIDEPLSTENVNNAMDKAMGQLSTLFANVVSNSIEIAV
jgi:hypothetical protein